MIKGMDGAVNEMKALAKAIRMKNEHLKDPKKPGPAFEPKHIMLYGPPGTGKSMLAMATAKESGAFFARINIESLRGDSAEEKLSGMLNNIASEVNGMHVVVLIDEADRTSGDPGFYE